MTLRPFLAVIVWLLLAAAAAAQTAAPATDVEAVIAEARKDGATVVIVRPRRAETPAAEPMSAMRAQHVLRARARLRDIAGSAVTLPAALAATWRGAAAGSGPWWWLRALLTAGLGLVLAWLVIRPIQKRSRAFFRPLYDPHPRTGADRAKYLLFRALLAAAYAGLYFALAMVVAVVLDSGHEPSRRLIFEIAVAYALYRLLRYGVAWNLTAWDAPAHRFVHLDDAQAVRMYHSWNTLVAVALIAGVAIRFLLVTGSPRQLGTLAPEHAAFLDTALIGLATVLLFVLVVVNWRGVQAVMAPAPDAPLAAARRVLARATPALLLAYALFAFAASAFRIALGEPAPAATVVAPFVIAYVALVAYGLTLIAVQGFYEHRARRWMAAQAAERKRHAAEVARLDARLAEDEAIDLPPPAPPAVRDHRPVLRTFIERAVLAVIVVVAFGELGRAWGVDVAAPGNWWASGLDILLAALLATIAYRAVCAVVAHRMEDQDVSPAEAEIGGEGGGAGVSREATLLPIVQWVVIAVIMLTAALVILSEFGVDIGPLLASAGVVGIAVGFGAQKLIQDVFSGAFFLLDDAFRRGEYIEVEGTKGTVQRISIRSFQLRHHLGALHTLPFGEIRQLTNYSRDWVLMKLPLRVTYDTDVERVRKLVKKLGQELLEHPEVGHTFLQPLKSQGVYRMEDSAMIIRVKFMTKPGEQFVTRKVVYAAIQELFAREGIRFAHKEVTVRLADEAEERLTPEQRRAVASAAREVVDAEDAEAAREAAE